MPRTLRVSGLGILTSLVLWQTDVTAQPCACGPDFCQNDPRYAPRLTQAKTSMRNGGYPENLITLMDKGGACFARISRAPVNFYIRVYANNAFQDVDWNEDNERIARTKLSNGAISVYYKFNTPRAFKCCGEKEYNERSDYDSPHDVNRSIVIECKMSAGNIVCQ